MTRPKIVLASAYNSTFTHPLYHAFVKLGFSVALFDYRNILGNFNYQPLFYLLLIFPAWVLSMGRPKSKLKISIYNELLYLTCFINKPKYLFTVKGETITAQTINRIKLLGITTILWQVDPTFDPSIWQYVDKIGRVYDLYVTCEPGKVVTELNKQGFSQVLYMLGAADGNIMHLFNEPKRFDVTFVGTYHPERARFLKALKSIDVHIWGWGNWQGSEVSNMFEGKPLTQSEMLDVYKQSKIVLNIGRAIGSTIPTNLRPFEAAQVGAFIIVDYKPNLNEVFKPGKEIDTFKTPSELRQKVEFYLNHPEKRAVMAKAMFARVRKDHTYEVRLKNLFKEIYELGY